MKSSVLTFDNLTNRKWDSCVDFNFAEREEINSFFKEANNKRATGEYILT